MAKNSPAFQFYPADFLIGVSNFSNQQVGMYSRLLAHNWTDRRLPFDRKQLLSKCCILLDENTDKSAADLDVVLAKFKQDNDGYYNQRLETEYLKYEAIREKRVKAGQKGGMNKGKANAKQTRSKCLAKRSKSEDRRLKIEDRNSKNEDRRRESDQFDEFWAVFPSQRKSKKPKAREAWDEAIETVDAKTIIDAAIEYAASSLGKSKFACMPSTWLNQSRWQDDRKSWQHGDDSDNGKPHKTFAQQRLDNMKAASAQLKAARETAPIQILPGITYER